LPPDEPCPRGFVVKQLTAGFQREAAALGGLEGWAGRPAPVAAVVAVGGGVALSYGIGTYGYELTHAGNWEAHIRQDGVISGVGEGFADASSAWWKEDAVGLKDRIGSSAKGLWNSVFG